MGMRGGTGSREGYVSNSKILSGILVAGLIGVVVWGKIQSDKYTDKRIINYQPEQIITRDYNGDGNNDIAITNRNGYTALFLDDGNGKYTRADDETAKGLLSKINGEDNSSNR